MRKYNRSTFPVALAGLSALGLPAVWTSSSGVGACRAQVARSWITAGGGNFNHSSNWSPFGVPGANDGADFGLPSSYTVNFATDRTVAGAYVGAGTVTFDLNPSGSARTFTVGGLDVAGFGAAAPTLFVRDGNVNAAFVTVRGGHLHIGPTETGQPPMTLNVTEDLQVKSGGRLTLNNFHSAHVLNANANVLIDGGMLRRFGGDSVSTGTAGFRLGAGRTITVQNAGSFDHGGTFGIQGNTLHVRSGGIASIDGLDIATTGAGTVLVEGAGSSLSMDVTFRQPGLQTWGAAGHAATVDIRGGASGTLKGALRLGSDGGASTSARFTVDGPGTTFAQTVFNADQFVIGHASTGSAQLVVRNGAVFTSEAGIYDHTGILINPTGRVDVESGATLAAVRITRNGGQFNMVGGTVRFDEFTGNLVNTSGTLRPGHRPDASAAFLKGSYTQQPAASMRADIGGVLAGETRPLIVTGNAVIDGTLELELVNDFVPILGNTFTIIQTQLGNVGGRFDRVNGTLPSPGLGLAVTYTPTQVLARATLPGDVNLDNQVNLADFNVLAGNFGTMGRTWVQADFTGDGLVNLQDFNALAGNFGLSAGADGAVDAQDWAALAAAVPEPGAALGAIVAAAGALVRRRRR